MMVDFYPLLRGTSVQNAQTCSAAGHARCGFRSTFKIRGLYWEDSPLPPGEGGARATMFANDEIVGRVPLIRRFRATFSRGEKDPLHRFSNYLGQHCLRGGDAAPI
jgi:hypothetical protein